MFASVLLQYHAAAEDTMTDRAVAIAGIAVSLIATGVTILVPTYRAAGFIFLLSGIAMALYAVTRGQRTSPGIPETVSWHELESRFRDLGRREVRIRDLPCHADLLGSGSERRWTVSGAPEIRPDCDRLCAVAGRQLLTSQKLRDSLSLQTRNERDDQSRWLYFLKEISEADKSWELTSRRPTGEQVVTYPSAIERITPSSARACLECGRDKNRARTSRAQSGMFVSRDAPRGLHQGASVVTLPSELRRDPMQTPGALTDNWPAPPLQEEGAPPRDGSADPQD